MIYYYKGLSTHHLRTLLHKCRRVFLRVCLLLIRYLRVLRRILSMRNISPHVSELSEK